MSNSKALIGSERPPSAVILFARLSLGSSMFQERQSPLILVAAAIALALRLDTLRLVDLGRRATIDLPDETCRPQIGRPQLG